MIFYIQHYVFVALGLVALAIAFMAFIDVLRRPAAAFVSWDRRTKGFWTAVLIAGLVFSYLSVPQFRVLGFAFGFGLPLFIQILAVLPGAVYLADVKPAVSRKSGGNQGPYGRW